MVKEGKNPSYDGLLGEIKAEQLLGTMNLQPSLTGLNSEKLGLSDATTVKSSDAAALNKSFQSGLNHLPKFTKSPHNQQITSFRIIKTFINSFLLFKTKFRGKTHARDHFSK